MNNTISKNSINKTVNNKKTSNEVIDSKNKLVSDSEKKKNNNFKSDKKYSNITLKKLQTYGKDKVVKSAPRYSKKQIPNLRYALLHSQLTTIDGVSIVMRQIEEVMMKQMQIPKDHIYYLVGKSKIHNSQIKRNQVLSIDNKINKLMIKHFQEGYGGFRSELVEEEINKAKEVISNFFQKYKIDVLVAHNSCHPVNFIMSVALSRYYRDCEKEGKKTPKYILWWHDSHLEREYYRHPSKDVKQYLLQGVPGRFVEYILFINSMQFNDAKNYLLELDNLREGFYEAIFQNHDVIYNTTDTFIDSFEDLEKFKRSERLDKFFEIYKIKEFLEKNKLSLSDVLFVLQHTRVLDRKRIDFAIKYAYELLKELKRKKIYKAIYFFVSGHSADNTKAKLKRLNRKLQKEYNVDSFYLIFAEDFKSKEIQFEEFPRLFATLDGISTYFSEIEGFGNNLLEVMASGLIPIVYTYPVFSKDLAKYKFKVIALDEFEVNSELIKRSIDIIKNKRKRKIWINRNLKLLKINFSHTLIARKLKRAIIRRRLHK